MLLVTVLLFTGSIKIVQSESTEEINNEDANKTNRNLAIPRINSHENTICPENWNGSIAHPIECSHYYRCNNGIGLLVHCDRGYVFDSEAKECISQSKAKCKGNSTDLFSNLCQKQVDGLYPNYDVACQQYFRCQSGHTVSIHNCPEGKTFSFYDQTCLSSQTVTCVRPVCHAEEDDFLWLPGSLCRSYYYCQRGTALAFNCPDGRQFSKDTKDCVVNGQCYEPICTGKTDGNHADTTQECKRFLQCRGGRLQGVTSCPPGHLYNGRSCLPAARTLCDRVESTAVAVEAIQDDCRGYSDGPHIIPATGCQRYQLCKDRKALARFSCPAGKRFNGIACVTQELAPCNDLCHGKKDGYHADEKEGCRKYHYCREEHITERRSCPEGSLFSGSMCLPAPLVSCEEAATPTNNPCLGLQDGFHADYLHGCSQYFYCSGYKPVLKTSCPKYTMWNSKQCAPSHETLCQGPEPRSDCHGLPTGLYQDKASGCSLYFFCRNGNRTMLSCPNGKLFDGVSCISQDEYVCPSQEPKTCYNKTDGYRTDEESGCRAYYYCSNNYKTTYVCPGRRLFNGTTCVEADSYTCPFTLNECTKKRDGYHPDFSTKCRKYYYCQDGAKLNTLSCGLHKAFDGTRCVFTTNPEATCRSAALQDVNPEPLYL